MKNELKLLYLLFSCSLFWSISITGQVFDSAALATQANHYLDRANSFYKEQQILEALFWVEKAQAEFQKLEAWEDYVETWITIARYLDGHPDEDRRQKAIKKAIAKGKKYLKEDHYPAGQSFPAARRVCTSARGNWTVPPAWY